MKSILKLPVRVSMDQKVAEQRLAQLKIENSSLETQIALKPEMPRVGGWMGVGIGEATKENPSAPPGVVILSVEAEGPAAQAGLEMGDIVLSVDGQMTGSTKDLRSILAKKLSGQTVVLELIRKDAVAKIDLTLSGWPP